MHVSPGLQVTVPHVTPPPELEAELDMEPVEVEVVDVDVEVEVVEVVLDVAPPMPVPVDVLAPAFAPPVPWDAPEPVKPILLLPPQPTFAATARPAQRREIHKGFTRTIPSTSGLESA
jgi:hypothetical protein